MIARMLVLAALAAVVPAALANAEMNADLKFCGWQSADDGRWYDERPENVRMRAFAQGIACNRAIRLIKRSGADPNRLTSAGGYQCRTRKHSASSEWTRTVRCEDSNPDVVLRWQQTY